MVVREGRFLRSSARDARRSGYGGFSGTQFRFFGNAIQMEATMKSDSEIERDVKIPAQHGGTCRPAD
jgi:hypothetical protein